MEIRHNLLTYPVFQILIPLILGIILQIKLHIYNSILLYVALILIVFIIIYHKYKSISYNYDKRWIFGISVNLIMFIIGIFLVKLNCNQPDYKRYEIPKTYIGTINSNPEVKDSYVKTIIAIKESPKPFSAIVYLELNEDLKEIEYGDILLFNTTLNTIKNRGNPHEFDYKKYMSYRNVFLQGFVKKDKWGIYETNSRFNVLYVSNKIRNKLLGIYKKYGIKGDELAIVSALTLGYKSNLSNKIKTTFSSSGSIHYLAVSGLHVGIIYLIFNALFMFLLKFKNGKIIHGIVIVTIIWIYAFITGISPSVQRAALMFTIIAVGKGLRRPVNIYQSLSLAAFISLLLNPFCITELGFQLSYLAVLGIAYFQPKLYRLIPVRNIIIDKLWAITCVSIAAQISTFPLTIYYFHQFPCLFLISNIIVLPFAFLIIFFSFILFILSFQNYIALVTAKGINLIVKALYGVILFIKNRPYAVVEDLLLLKSDLILIYLLIILLTLYIIFKNKKVAILVLCTITLIVYSNLYYDFQLKQQKKIVVYNIKGESVYGFYNKYRGHIFSTLKPLNVEKSIKSDLIYSGIKKKNRYLYDSDSTCCTQDLHTIRLFNGNNKIMCFYDKKVLVINEVNMLNNITSNISVDYIIISENPDVSISKLQRYFLTKKVVFDSSNSYYNVANWVDECNKLGIPYHDVKTQESFKVTL